MTSTLHKRLACLPYFWWAASWSSFCFPYGRIVLVMCYNVPPKSVPQALLLEDKLLVSLFLFVSPWRHTYSLEDMLNLELGALNTWRSPHHHKNPAASNSKGLLQRRIKKRDRERMQRNNTKPCRGVQRDSHIEAVSSDENSAAWPMWLCAFQKFLMLVIAASFALMTFKIRFK